MQSFRAFTNSRSAKQMAIWLLVTLIIYPIPHTIALRNILLGVGLIVCAAQFKHLSRLRPLLPEGGVLLVLSVWLILQAIFISHTPGETLDLIRGDWIVALAVMTLGLLFVLRMATLLNITVSGETICTTIVAALYAMILFCLADQVWLWLQDGSFVFGYARFGNRDNLSVLTNTGLSLVIGDILSRAVLKKPATHFSNRILGALFLAGLIATYTLATRNGTIGVALFLLLTLGILLRHLAISPKTLAIGILLVITIGGIAIGSYHTDSRWKGLSETVGVALDTDNNRFWLNDRIFPRPQTPSGAPLEESAYMRIAWAKEAVRQIGKHPFGVGYNHQALGAAIKLEYDGPIRVGASHNGLLEFALGGGIPAIVLWLLFTALLLRRGWHSFFHNGTPAGMLLFFSVFCYFSRCALDGHLTGHRLEMFMLITALLSATCVLPSETEQER